MRPAAILILITLAGLGCRRDKVLQTMRAKIVAEEQIPMGRKVVVEAASPNGKHVVVFEDDGDTGYLYAVERARPVDPIVDALLIYTVNQVTDRLSPSTLQLVWSADALKALLLINRHPQAVFDFAARRGYCRTALPPSDKRWTQHGHEWDDEVISLFL